MTYDSPLWAFDGEVITAVANFKEEGLVTQEGEKEEKRYFEIYLNLSHLRQRQECWPPHYLDIGIRRSKLNNSTVGQSVL